MSEKYSISVRSYQVIGVGTHYAVTFNGPQGSFEMNGFPLDPETGEIVFGEDGTALAVVAGRFDGRLLGEDVIFETESFEEFAANLGQAVLAANEINNSGLGYSLLGPNSNSAAFTILEAMGLDYPGRPGAIDPGYGTRLLGGQTIAQIRSIDPAQLINSVALVPSLFLENVGRVIREVFGSGKFLNQETKFGNAGDDPLWSSPYLEAPGVQLTKNFATAANPLTIAATNINALKDTPVLDRGGVSRAVSTLEA